MKKFITCLMLALLAASAHPEPVWRLVPNAPTWRNVKEPTTWPTDHGGSNQLSQCVADVESEIKIANQFLATGHYRVLHGGIKSQPPHIRVPHPDTPDVQWTIFFNPDNLHIGTIVSRSRDTTSRINLNPQTQFVITAQLEPYILRCNTNGTPTIFAVRIIDKKWYTVEWNNEGSIKVETVYDWEKRGRIIK